ncbi:PREDICTED: protein strawberry notch homolog 2-like [Ceratotherium simum simum]|uniref:Protein strawberry notch homolog 2-like n=1 Tax=Ceratotherium simum simum TaxID=73337 RepID=A0ABM1DI33_CERSS|nr:PREDICTED: protein strawberry notch homolog 2-like [Ceratotherium simum simum]
MREPLPPPARGPRGGRAMSQLRFWLQFAALNKDSSFLDDLSNASIFSSSVDSLSDIADTPDFLPADSLSQVPTIWDVSTGPSAHDKLFLPSGSFTGFQDPVPSLPSTPLLISYQSQSQPEEEDEAEEDEAEELGHTETYADYVPSKCECALWEEPPQHEVLLPGGQRAGFLIGDGAGVGKGRTVAGIILENYLRGRKKSLWFSVSNDLKYDAERDLRDIEAPCIAVHALSKIKYGDNTTSEGVLFATYSALIGESQAGGQHRTRIRQILEWCGEAFDGVAVPRSGGTGPHALQKCPSLLVPIMGQKGDAGLGVLSVHKGVFTGLLLDTRLSTEQLLRATWRTGVTVRLGHLTDTRQRSV